MKKLVLWSIVIVFLATFCFAQSDEYHKNEVFAGFSSGQAIESDDSLEPPEPGFNVAVVHNIHRYIGIKADVSGTFKKIEDTYYSTTNPIVPLNKFKADHSLVNATVGIQFKNNSVKAKFKPFAHILVGYGSNKYKATTVCSSNATCRVSYFDTVGTSTIIGGGFDIKINRRIDVRIIQFDYNGISDSNGSWENVRFSTGIVFKF
jgi:hypothetical protein